MISTTNFLIWFYSGMGGLGGWAVFFLIALFSVLYVVLDSNNRRLPASGWRLSILLVSILILPAAICHFLPDDIQGKFSIYTEYLFYAGMVGGLIPLFMLIGYLLQYKGMVVCEKGHLYPKMLNECPECIPTDFEEYDPSELEETQLDLNAEDTDTLAEGISDDTEVVEREFFETQMGTVGMPKKDRPKASGFLLFPEEHSVQLNHGVTMLGRSSANDCMLQNTYVSRSHAKIVEEGRNLFRLYDLGSSNGTWLNGRKLMKATLLENNDKIRFGDEITVVFLSSREI